MADKKSWFCKWSFRCNKVYYVNIDTNESSWVKPEGFIASEDDVKKISEYKSRKRCSSSSDTPDSREGKRPLEAITDDNSEFSVEDYLEVYSKKRKMFYYYNLKSKSSQWKRPACLLAAETQQAIEKTRNKEETDSCNGTTPAKIQNGEKKGTTLNADAPCFVMSISKLSVNAAPFVPSEQPKERGASETVHKSCPGKDSSIRKVVVKRTRSSEDCMSEKPKARISAKERLSLGEPRTGVVTSGCQDNEVRGENENNSEVRSSVFDRLGQRSARFSDESLLEDAKSNVCMNAEDLITVPYLPPCPKVEEARYNEVSVLRNRFEELCDKRLGIEVPTEALNRWLLERQLNCTKKIDPVLSWSDKESVSLYREIMQDLPVKYRVPKNSATCTTTLTRFVEKFENMAAECNEDDASQIKVACDETLKLNTSYSDTRELMRKLRGSCDKILTRYYHEKVDAVCEEINTHCQEAAAKLSEMTREEHSSLLPALPPQPLSTGLVGCRPAMPRINDEALARGAAVTDSRSGTRCEIRYGNIGPGEFLNTTHYEKLEMLYKSTALSDLVDRNLFNSRVWCLLKRYKMLRSSMCSGRMSQENFGLHAALPRKVFELLHRKFRVTFECFASPFNCYFGQYCSAFPDIDCYFGSRGSFFDLKPKTGSFQANPPFSEEVMLAMANHMITLIEESRGPLRFVIFIPDWQVPLTPAIPTLQDSEYCSHNILLESGTHQYITGNQHIQQLSHYNAVHGTQVFVLENKDAKNDWPITHRDMERLREAMSSNSKFY